MKRRVLIVDDDAAVRESLEKVLVAAGYAVVLAVDGQAGRQRFEQGDIDLLLLDLKLPDQSGWEVYEQVTRREPGIPIIILTGLPDRFPSSVAAGAGALIEKPVHVPQLLATMAALLREPPRQQVERLCGYRQDTRFLPSADPPPGPPASGSNVYEHPL